MAIDEPSKRKRGTPVGDPQSAKPKMGQKMVRQRWLALLDHGSSSSSRRQDDNNNDFEPTGKGGTPAGDSLHPAKTEMGQKMALAHRRLSLFDDDSSISKHIAAAAAAATDDDDDPDFEPMGEEVDVDVAKKNMAVDNSDDPDGDKVDFVLLGRKRTGRQAGARYTKRKIEKKPTLVDSNNISKSNKETDDDFEPEVSDDDDRKNYSSVLGFYGTALERALEVEKKLPAGGPSFVKLMRISHVERVFWLSVPASFCREHLPKHDVTIVLEDEDGHGFDTNYLARKQGFSGGWNRFAARHNLKVGDAVVFQLVGPARFKVYILRENKFTTTDGVLGLLSLDTSTEKTISKKGEETSDEDVKSKEDRELTRVSNKISDDDSNEFFSEEAANGGSRSADPDPDFDSVRTFRTFKMVVDSSVIDRKLLPDRLLWTYYKLCDARNAFLHRHLPKCINPMLAAGVIAEMVSIAEGIRAYTASSSFEDFVAWKKTLESFELLGMDVGFMRKRVDEFLFLLDARPSDNDPPEGYEEVKLERARAVEKVRALESNMANLKDALKEMDMEMKEIVQKRRGQAMLQLAAAAMVIGGVCHVCVSSVAGTAPRSSSDLVDLSV